MSYQMRSMSRKWLEVMEPHGKDYFLKAEEQWCDGGCQEAQKSAGTLSQEWEEQGKLCCVLGTKRSAIQSCLFIWYVKGYKGQGFKAVILLPLLPCE